jgi:acyl-CoA synthetase (AMP-forming)/AMP-acid ligase II
MRIVDLVERNARLYADREAVAIVGGARLTHRQVRDRATRMASGLAAAGVGRGDRIGLVADNGVVYFDLYLAAAYLGAAVVPVNTHLTPPEIAYVLGHAEPVVTLADPEYRDRVPPPYDTVIVGSDAYDELIAAPARPDLAGLADDRDTALIIYTSGTTGRPKGVCLSQHALVFNGITLALVQGFTPDEVMLSMTPLYHAATGTRITTMLVDGQRHVVLPKFDAETCLETLEREGVTTTVAVPTQLRRIIESPSLRSTDLSRLRLLVYGAAPTAVPLIERALAELPCGFYQGYGLTEATTNLTGLLPSDHRGPDANPARLASCGRAVPGVDLRICDDDGAPLPAGEVGEIRVRTDKLMTGYWRDEDATRAAIVDGWLRTGDLGTMDHEGYVTIVGRAKDMLISGGVNVYPSEIEAVLQRQPGVADVAVVGRPDDEWGEVPVAFVLPGPGAVVDPERLAAACRDQLAPMKIPREIRVVDDLPRTATGKIRKVELRDLVR